MDVFELTQRSRPQSRNIRETTVADAMDFVNKGVWNMVIRSFLGISRALILGVLMGPIYKIVACSEYLNQSNYELIWLWKKYPKRSYDRFTATLWANSLSNNRWRCVGAACIDIENRFPSEPFPTLKIVANLVLIILTIPISFATGLIQGPLFLMREHFEYEQTKTKDTGC